MSRMCSALSSLLTAPLADGVKWPCKVRWSSRVHNPKISVHPLGHVELVLPKKIQFTLFQQQEFLQSMLPWLQKTLDRILPRAVQHKKAEQLLQEYTGILSAKALPQSIHLPLLGEHWKISKHDKVGGYIRAKELRKASETHTSLPSLTQDSYGELGIYAKETEIFMCCLLLQRWLVKKATEALTLRTKKLADIMNVDIAKVSVKAQRGRWGSCTSAGNISLNGRLLLLQPYLVDHVIYHELCHRVHMNHSTAFKKLLEKFSPQSLQKDKELSHTWKNLPLWALLSKHTLS